MSASTLCLLPYTAAEFDTQHLSFSINVFGLNWGIGETIIIITYIIKPAWWVCREEKIISEVAPGPEHFILYQAGSDTNSPPLLTYKYADTLCFVFLNSSLNLNCIDVFLLEASSPRLHLNFLHWQKVPDAVYDVIAHSRTPYPDAWYSCCITVRQANHCGELTAAIP